MKTTLWLGLSAVLFAALPADALNVNVNPGGPTGCTIEPVDDVHLSSAGSVTWNVKPANAFKFDANGILFVKKPDHDDPAGEFDNQSSSETTWVVQDKHTKKGKFGYEVHIKGQNSSAHCMLDPTVFND